MNTLRAVRKEIVNIGYAAGAVVDDYVYSDVFLPTPSNRRVALAAFTQTPPSYRSAALAVVSRDGRDAATIVEDHRSLGAPLVFVIENDGVTVWQVRSDAAPRPIASSSLQELPALFAKNRQAWSPLSIHRAKSIGTLDKAYQLDFVDLGLLPAIEGEIHSKLDRLLSEILADIAQSYAQALDERALFRTIFRLLSAKVLLDRGHKLTENWDADNLDSILDTISSYYHLPRLISERPRSQQNLFGSAWSQLRNGINFRNISADDLAFVYENTLVTPETRKHFGTHSTPRQVAEYVVGRLELWQHDPNDLHIYEPFAGAGVFLVAALRHLRDLLSIDWTDRKRHDFLVKRIFGDELDAFACEVATLSLILADYPNANGWKVSNTDLFQDFALSGRVKAANVVLCNPPFESFSDEDRIRYPEAASRSYSKPIAALEAVLDARPLALGFVLPRPFLTGSQYDAQRRKIEETYRNIEVVSLPDRTFSASVIRSSLLIAHSPRSEKSRQTSTVVRTSVVAERDRDQFLRTGEITETRSLTRPFTVARGDLWIGELDDLWRYLGRLQTLDTVALVHRGIEWRGGQSNAVKSHRERGFVRGVHAANSVQTFAIAGPVVWLDARSERLLYKAIDLPWQQPKVIANAARLSRGPWCLAAAVDRVGLVASQQLFGIWPRNESEVSIEAISAILNSPLGNAFVSTHSPPDRIRVSAIRALPIPAELPRNLIELVSEYTHYVSTDAPLFDSSASEHAASLLNRIDAIVLAAYDLPPRLERKLLEYFRGSQRPTVHQWPHWLPENFGPALRLHEFLSLEFSRVARPWPLEVFEPLPDNEAKLLREYME